MIKNLIVLSIGILILISCKPVKFYYEKGDKIAFLNERQMEILRIKEPNKVLMVFEHSFEEDTLMIIHGRDTIIKAFPDNRSGFVDGTEIFTKDKDVIIIDKKIKKKIIIPITKHRNYKFIYLRRMPKSFPKEWDESTYRYRITFTNTFRRYL